MLVGGVVVFEERQKRETVSEEEERELLRWYLRLLESVKGESERLPEMAEITSAVRRALRGREQVDAQLYRNLMFLRGHRVLKRLEKLPPRVRSILLAYLLSMAASILRWGRSTSLYGTSHVLPGAVERVNRVVDVILSLTPGKVKEGVEAVLKEYKLDKAHPYKFTVEAKSDGVKIIVSREGEVVKEEEVGLDTVMERVAVETVNYALDPLRRVLHSIATSVLQGGDYRLLLVEGKKGGVKFIVEVTRGGYRLLYPELKEYGKRVGPLARDLSKVFSPGEVYDNVKKIVKAGEAFWVTPEDMSSDLKPLLAGISSVVDDGPGFVVGETLKGTYALAVETPLKVYEVVAEAGTLEELKPLVKEGVESLRWKVSLRTLKSLINWLKREGVKVEKTEPLAFSLKTGIPLYRVEDTSFFLSLSKEVGVYFSKLGPLPPLIEEAYKMKYVDATSELKGMVIEVGGRRVPLAKARIAGLKGVTIELGGRKYSAELVARVVKKYKVEEARVLENDILLLRLEGGVDVFVVPFV